MSFSVQIIVSMDEPGILVPNCKMYNLYIRVIMLLVIFRTWIFQALLANALAANGQASWGVSIVHNGQPGQVYYVNTDSNPSYNSYLPFFFLTPSSNGGAPDMAQPPPGVEINPDAEVFDPSGKNLHFMT